MDSHIGSQRLFFFFFCQWAFRPMVPIFFFFEKFGGTDIGWCETHTSCWRWKNVYIPIQSWKLLGLGWFTWVWTIRENPGGENRVMTTLTFNSNFPKKMSRQNPSSNKIPPHTLHVYCRHRRISRYMMHLPPYGVSQMMMGNQQVMIWCSWK